MNLTVGLYDSAEVFCGKRDGRLSLFQPARRERALTPQIGGLYNHWALRRYATAHDEEARFSEENVSAQ